MDSSHLPPPNVSGSERAPYGSFIFSLVLFTVGLVGAVFSLAFATAQGSPDTFDSLRRDGAWIVGLIGTAIWAQRTWSQIVRVEAVPTFRQKHRSFMMEAGAAICVALGSAAMVGGYLGIRAGHFARIKLLTQQFDTFAAKGPPAKQKFVLIARRETPTMPEYIQRCSELEAALNDYEPNLREGDRLIGQTLEELQYLKADAGYAKLIPMATALQSVLHKDLESAPAFRKEVDYAKRLAALSTPEDRERFYRANILPVKDDEDRIANEEIEILRDARAHGVKLPESMYREAGIQ
ncbi:MAG TPA: hypothetical protein VOA78_12255 [Candidatus Dormibacteraeota bacterium]|nr:hypothetical protein [Candidatus Dormibacteraeota bacterium]